MERGVKACAASSGYQLTPCSVQAAFAAITLKLSHTGRARGQQGAGETQPALVLLWKGHRETTFAQGSKLKAS